MNIHKEVINPALLHEVTLVIPPDDDAAPEFEDEILQISPIEPLKPTNTVTPSIPSVQPHSLIRQKYTSLAELGEEMLEMLRKNKTTNHGYWDGLLRGEEFSKYLAEIESHDLPLSEAISAIETAHQPTDLTKRQRLLHYYTVAFLIADDKCLYVDNKPIADIANLVAHMKALLDSSYSDLERFCHKMVSYDGVLDLQLEAWLTAQGKQSELAEWRKRIAQ